MPGARPGFSVPGVPERGQCWELRPCTGLRGRRSTQGGHGARGGGSPGTPAGHPGPAVRVPYLGGGTHLQRVLSGAGGVSSASSSPRSPRAVRCCRAPPAGSRAMTAPRGHIALCWGSAEPCLHPRYSKPSCSSAVQPPRADLPSPSTQTPPRAPTEPRDASAVQPGTRTLHYPGRNPRHPRFKPTAVRDAAPTAPGTPPPPYPARSPTAAPRSVRPLQAGRSRVPAGRCRSVPRTVSAAPAAAAAPSPPAPTARARPELRSAPLRTAPPPPPRAPGARGAALCRGRVRAGVLTPPAPTGRPRIGLRRARGWVRA